MFRITKSNLKLCVFCKLVLSSSAAPHSLTRCGSQPHVCLNPGTSCAYITVKTASPLPPPNACFSPGSSCPAKPLQSRKLKTHVCLVQFPAPTQLTCGNSSSSNQAQPMGSMLGCPWSPVASLGARHLLSSQ